MLNKYPPIVKLINSFMNVLTNLLDSRNDGLKDFKGLSWFSVPDQASVNTIRLHADEHEHVNIRLYNFFPHH